MPLGNPLGYLQGQGGGAVNPQLIQFMMQMLQQAPQKPAGEFPTAMPSGAVPHNLRVPTAEEQSMSMLLQMLQAPQVGQQALNAGQGIQGGAFGGLGGRPRGS
jgi:hypothetical protein